MQTKTKSILHVAKKFLPPLLFLLAAWLLYKELRHYSLREIILQFATISHVRLALAAGLAIVAYLAMTGYDWLAFCYIRNPLPMTRIASAAFISYAVSYNLGHTLVTGGTVRYRLYKTWGLSKQDIATVVLFCVFTFWVGVCAVAGALFLYVPNEISDATHLPVSVVRPIGVALLMIVGTYLLWTGLRRTPLQIRGRTFAIPPIWISAAQIVVTIIDLVLAGTVLYVLLPEGMGLSYPAMICVYLISIILGLASQVPGGLGVFELAFLRLAPESTSSASLAGALLAYRVVYYLLPLVIALVLMGYYEMKHRRGRSV